MADGHLCWFWIFKLFLGGTFKMKSKNKIVLHLENYGIIEIIDVFIISAVAYILIYGSYEIKCCLYSTLLGIAAFLIIVFLEMKILGRGTAHEKNNKEMG